MPWGAFDRAGSFASVSSIGSTIPRTTVWLHAGDAGVRARAAVHYDQLTTALSDPDEGNRWFAATLNPAFPFATTFLGDYSNIAAEPSGGVVAYWTDLRNQACFGGRCGSGQDAFFATAP